MQTIEKLPDVIFIADWLDIAGMGDVEDWKQKPVTLKNAYHLAGCCLHYIHHGAASFGMEVIHGPMENLQSDQSWMHRDKIDDDRIFGGSIWSNAVFQPAKQASRELAALYLD